MKMMKRWLAFMMVLTLLIGIMVNAGNPLFANELGEPNDTTGTEAVALTSEEADEQAEAATVDETDQAVTPEEPSIQEEPAAEETPAAEEQPAADPEEAVPAEQEQKDEAKKDVELNTKGIAVELEDGSIQWTKEDDKSYITVLADAEILSKTAVLCVSEITDKETTDKIDRTVEEQVIADNQETSVAIQSTTSYDIHFEDENGNEIQPNGEVKVQITGKVTNEGEETLVYHVDDTAKNAEDMNAVDIQTEDTSSVGDVEFDTTHFSTYTVINTTKDPINVTVEYYDNSKKPAQKIYLDHTETLKNTNELKIGSHEGNWEVEKLVVNDKEYEDVSNDVTVEVAQQKSKVQIYYQPVEITERGNNVTFYDYTLRAGHTKTSSNRTYWYNSGTPVSINSPENYQGNYLRKMCSGLWHWDDYWSADYNGVKVYFGQHNYKEVTFNFPNQFDWQQNGQPVNKWTGDSKAVVTGLMSGVDSSGNPVFTCGQPGFFNDTPKSVTAKKENSKNSPDETRYTRNVLKNYELEFEVQGDTFTLDNVYRDGGNESMIPDYAKEKGTRNSKDYDIGEFFFPMDKETKSYEESAGVSSDFREPHNFFFGMRYDISFKLGDYIGDLKYTFSGDDDMWLVLSEKDGKQFTNSKVVLDLGGIHSPIPIDDSRSSVDLWQKLLNMSEQDYNALSTEQLEGKKEEFLKENGNKDYQLSVFYMERGANRSQCYMKFTVPSANVVSVTDIPKTDYSFSKTDEVGVALSGAKFGLYDNPDSQNATQTVTSGTDGSVQFTDLYAGKTYYVKEISAPDGYMKSDIVYRIEVTQNNNGAEAKMYRNSNNTEVSSVINSRVNNQLEYNKTAEVFDYENRVYKIDLSASSKWTSESISDPVDIVFVVDKSGSMRFPSDLVTFDKWGTKVNNWQQPNKKITTENLDLYCDKNTSYYAITDPTGAATVWRIFYKDGSWRWIDSSNEGAGTKFSEKYPTGMNNNTDQVLYVAGNEYNRLHYLQESLTGFISTLQSQSPQSNVGLVSYAYDVIGASTELIAAKDADSLIHDIEDTSTAGGTNHAKGLEAAYNLLKRQNDGRKKYVVLVTDGCPNVKNEAAETSKQNIINQANNIKGLSNTSLITVGLSLGDVESARELMNTISTSGLAFEAEKGTNLEGIFDSIYSTIIQSLPITNATIKDVVDPRFNLVDKDTNIPLEEGDTIEGGIVHKDANGNYSIEWTRQTIPGKSGTEAGWHKSIYVKAKEDFIGGNTITTNTPDSGITIENTTLPFPEPSVNVKLLNLTQADKEITVLKGDNVTPKDLLKEFTTDNIPQIVEIVKDNEGNFVKINIPDNCKLTEADWKSLVDGTTNVIKKNYSYAETGDVVGHFEYTIKAVKSASGTLDKHDTREVGKHVEQYQLIVTYVPKTDREDPNSSNPGTKVTDSLKSENNYYVNVVTIELDVTKYGKETAGSNTKAELSGAVFKLEKKNSDNTWSQVGNNVTSGSDGTLKFESLVLGEYKLTEVEAPVGYSLIKDPILFTISKADAITDGNNSITIPIEGKTINNSYKPGIKVDNTAVSYVESNHPDMEQNFTYYLQADVDNVELYELPNSGGIGTYLFTISGVAILMIALLLFIQNEQRTRGGKKRV